MKTGSPPSLPISETFTSVQGEGRLTGTRSFFIRTSGCNLRCGWCDTPYASWSPEGDRRTIDDLLAEAKESGADYAVVTGGEPMIFDAVFDLCRALRQIGMHVTIETAGTVYPSAWRGPNEPLGCDLMSISPKLSNSTPAADDPRDPGGVWRKRHEQRRLDPPTLQQLIDDHPERQLKFVVASPDDLREIDELVRNLSGLGPADIMLMPEGVTVPTEDAVRWVRQACSDRGWVYCRRLHIELFGDRRGT
ncbi:MAG: 7-carboxy-7-deazaguanine synthase QueE [Planctomycetota bacterium]